MVIADVQLRGNQKDFNFQLHHRLSKFEVPVVVNLKHIFELFGLNTTCFLIQKLLELIRLSSHGQFWRKSQNKKGGKFKLGSQLYYYNCNIHLCISENHRIYPSCPYNNQFSLIPAIRMTRPVRSLLCKRFRNVSVMNRAYKKQHKKHDCQYCKVLVITL